MSNDTAAPPQNNIRITGSARKRIVSDLIEWSASVEAKAPERTAACIALKSGTDKAVYADMGIITIVHASYEVN